MDTKNEVMINGLASELANKVLDLVKDPCARLKSYEVAVPDFLDQNNKVTNGIIGFLEIMAFDMARVPKILAAANKVKELIDEKKNFSEYYKDAESKKLELEGSKCALAIMDGLDKDDSPYGCPIWFGQYVPRIKLFTIEIDKLREKATAEKASKSDGSISVNIEELIKGINKELKNKKRLNGMSENMQSESKEWLKNLNKELSNYRRKGKNISEGQLKKQLLENLKKQLLENLKKIEFNMMYTDISNEIEKLKYQLDCEINNKSATMSGFKQDKFLKNFKNVIDEIYGLVSDKFKGTKDEFMKKVDAYIKNTGKISPTLSEKFDADVGKAFNEGSVSAKYNEGELLTKMIAGLLSNKENSKTRDVINDWKKLEENYNKFKSAYLNDVKELRNLVGNNDENIVKYIDLKSNEFEKNVPNISKAPNMVDAYVIKLGSFCDWSEKFVDSFNITDKKTECAKKLGDMKRTVKSAKEFLKKYLPKDQESNAKI